MTGSGKTGLCIDLLEEAAIDGIPALVIDPKGDIGNLLLQFPNLRPEDFRALGERGRCARAQGMTADQFAAAQAELWSKGLAEWGQDGERIQRLQSSADFAIYTPGSNAGIPISLLKSFAAAGRGRSLTIASSSRSHLERRDCLLALMGIDADPMKSREHILLSNIFDTSWKSGEDLTIDGAYPCRFRRRRSQRIGVLDLESFYPAKDRFELAMALNNLLASPGLRGVAGGRTARFRQRSCTRRTASRASRFSRSLI